ncbi:MAG TPA: PIN domain-containing protein [Candidatus Lokiarchaeia archaeon]|nr:PIN domain-containing protein [Candidatus Lokiarchaeia archaeon]
MDRNNVKIMGVLLDTGFLYGLKDEHDPRHDQAAKILESFNWTEHAPAVTTDLIVAEVYSLLNARSKGNKMLFPAFNELFWGSECFFRIRFLDNGDFKHVVEILEKFTSPRKILSAADASLIYVGQQASYDTIISFDEHFDGIISRIADF